METDRENFETKEHVEGEILLAIRFFIGDLRNLTALANDKNSSALTIAELNHLAATLQHTARRLENLFAESSDDTQLKLKFPGW